MTTTATGATATAIIDSSKIALSYAEALLNGVTPDKFAVTPDGVDTNHPAWIIGHLALYPDYMILPTIGRADLALDVDEWNTKYGHGSECVSDPDGKIYPSMDELVTRFSERHKLAQEQVLACDDALLGAALPDDHRFKGRMSTVGAVVNFMFNDHVMMHLGQLSAWRRIMGMGPCM